jgi:protein subunit release factor B
MNIRTADVVETFVRSGGKGGQRVNKVETGVILKHVPTGIVVRCTDTRSQSQNREIAWQRLAESLAKREERARTARRHAAEKERRKKRRPSRKAKERNLEQKKRRAKVKQTRGRVRDY